MYQSVSEHYKGVGVTLKEVCDWFNTRYPKEVNVSDVVKIQRHCDEKTSFWTLRDEVRWMLGYKKNHRKKVVCIAGKHFYCDWCSLSSS